jgi:hypothetical protein
VALPPRLLGAHRRPVRLERADDQRYRAYVGEQPLSATFGSAEEAREAAAAEGVRLDALALAFVRRVRSRSSRKQR